MLDFGVGVPEPPGTPAQYAAVRHALAVWQVNTVVIATDPAAPTAAAGPRPHLCRRLHDGGARPPAHDRGRGLGLEQRPARPLPAPASSRPGPWRAVRRQPRANQVLFAGHHAGRGVCQFRRAACAVRPGVRHSSACRGSADQEESGAREPVRRAPADQAVPPARARVGWQRGGRCWRDALGCARPAGRHAPASCCACCACWRRPGGRRRRPGRRAVARADGSSGARVAFPLAPGLSGSEHAALERAGAYGGHPVRLLILGDSIAMTLGMGLSVDSQRQYGVSVTDDATVGCDLDPQLQVFTSGAAGPATPGCDNWRGAVALPRGGTAAPGGGPGPRALGDRPTTCSTGTGCTSASRPGTST